MMEPFNSMMISAERLVSLMTRETNIVIPTYITSLKLTSRGSGHSITPKNLFFAISKNSGNAEYRCTK